MKQALKIIGIMSFAIFLFVAIVLTKFKNHVDDEYDNDHPKTQNIEELKAWAQKEIVQDYCERYAKVKNINNETNQQRELSRVENSRFAYVPQKIRNVIEENDLPDSYADELYHYVDDEINKCQ
jgi:hypothetical protein